MLVFNADGELMENASACCRAARKKPDDATASILVTAVIVKKPGLALRERRLGQRLIVAEVMDDVF